MLSRVERPHRRLDFWPVAAGNVGNLLEWYDFVVFAFLAPVIGARFFPSADALSGLINAFGVFAVGYLMRPIGGILFGHLGDRLGRKGALQLSMVVMAIPTALMAALPTHAEAGVLAPVLLVALRLAQGLSVGGEYAGSMCYLVEAAPPGRRALFGSLSILGIAGGLVLAAGVVSLIGSILPAEQMYAWGWRLPFLGGLVIGGVGWWMRRGLAETPAFLEVVEAGRTARAPIVVVLREHWRRLVEVGGMVILVAVGFYAVFAWMPTYLRQIVRPPVAHAGLINMASIVVLILAIPVAGWMSDRVGYRPVLLAANLAYAAAAVPLFHVIDTGGIVAVTGAVFGLAIIHAFSNGPIPAALSELLPTEVRYTGIALGTNVAFAIFGGTAPLVATWLIKATGDLAAPAWYLVAVALVSACVTFAATRPGTRAGTPSAPP
jgi:MFS transporter, MHS family, proline/betaine transporter